MKLQNLTYRPYILFIASLLALSGCSSPTSPGKDYRKEILKNGWEKELGPNLTALKQKASDLQAKSEAFCNKLASGTPQEKADAKKEAQDAWVATYLAVKLQEAFIFGPYNKVPITPSRRSLLMGWPLNAKSVQNALSTYPSKKNLLSNNEVGLPALEYLLFNTTPDPTTDPNYCAYLKDLSNRIVSVSSDLYDAWDPQQWKPGQTDDKTYRGWYYNLEHPGTIDNIRDYRTALASLINGSWHMIQNLYKDNLSKIYEGSTHRSKEEATLSKKNLEGTAKNIESIKQIYLGTLPEDPKVVSFSSVLKRYKPALDQKIREQFKKVEADIKNMTDADMVKGNSKFNTLITDIKDLNRLFYVDILQTLGLTRSGNDSDND